MPRKAKAEVAKGQGEKSGKAKATAGAVKRQPEAKLPPTDKKARSHRATEIEIEERTDFTERLMAAAKHKSEIRRELKARYGLDWRTIDLYIGRARERMLLKLTVTKDEYRAGALSFFQSVVASDTASDRDKIRAQQQICRLLGLDSPIKVAQTDASGKDLPPDEARDRISTLASRIAERLGKSGVDDGSAVGGA